MTAEIEVCEIRWTRDEDDKWPDHDQSTNGRPADHPGHLAATVGPYPGGFNVVVHQVSWLKPYWTRAWPTREEARAMGARILLKSLGSQGPMEREGLGALIREHDREVTR